MTMQITQTGTAASGDSEGKTVPSGTGFTPRIASYSADRLTLGRQVFNDSDKDNYFEG